MSYAIGTAEPAPAGATILPPPPAADSTATSLIVIEPSESVAMAVPEQIGLWGLLGILYPLLLLVGLRLLRIGTRRARAWARRRLDDWYGWLTGAGVTKGRARILRRTADLVLRLAELAVYLLCIYMFSLYFFLLIPGTRELGLDMAHQLWPPLRGTILLVLRTLAYLVFAAIVLAGTRWFVPQLRQRLGVAVARPTTHRERERLLVLRCANWVVYFIAAVVVIVALPGPGQRIGTLLLALTLLVLMIGARRTLENVAAGFSVGRVVGGQRGTRIRCGDCCGVIEEWTLTGLWIRDGEGNLVHLPYRVCEDSALTIAADDEAPA